MTIDEVMDELQDGFDFSYFAAEVQGKQLTEEQHKAKDRTLVNLVLSETIEHNERLHELFRKVEA